VKLIENRTPGEEKTMENATMGRVLVEAQIENIGDLYDASRSLMAEDKVRRVVVPDALVDSGATMLSLPTRIIQQLGLRKVGTKRATASSGHVTDANLYDAVRLTVRDRSCTIDVAEVPDNVPVQIGQIPLEMLDYVIDLRSCTLIGNPRHGGEHMIDL
jgi:predicted aspartyl protease